MPSLFTIRRNRWAAALVSGLLLMLVVNLHPWWPVAWIAPIPLLLAAFYTSAGEAFWLALFAGLIAHSSNFVYYNSTTGGPLVGAGIILLQALAWAVAVRFTRRIVLRASPVFSLYAYPLAWAALDTVITALSPHSSFGSLAYSQGAALSILQIAKFTGTPGIVFLVSLGASTIAVAIYRHPRTRWYAAGYALPVVLIAGALWFGQKRLDSWSSSTPLTAGLISIDDFAGPRVPLETVDSIWNQYENAIGHLAAQGAKIILLPEKIQILDAEAAGRRLGQLATAARHNAVYLAAGTGHHESSAARNRMWMFDPSGELIATYDKHHLVPGLEAEFQPSKDFTVQTIAGVHYGFAICKDMHFPAMGRAYGRLRVDAMLIPAWDFYSDMWMAERITALRGIESGFSVIRSSREGLLTVSDNRGRILARAESVGSPGASLLATVPIAAAELTPYAQYGDGFGWTCFVLVLALRIFVPTTTSPSNLY